MKVANKAVSFVPGYLLDWIDQGIIRRSFISVVAFADVSGFTDMSARLATTGKEGAETLTAILNRYFTRMINIIENNCGFVGKFGGDAMTIFFPCESAKDLASVIAQAVATCMDLQSVMDEFHGIETKAGKFSLGMKIGIAAGSVLYQVVGNEEEGREFLLAGQPLDDAAEAEHHGTSGEVVLHPSITEIASITGRTTDDGFVILNSEDKKPETSRTSCRIEPQPGWAEIARTFIDDAVYKRILLGLDSVGEIRRISVIFMSFRGLDYVKDSDVSLKLDSIYNWVMNLTIRFNGSINKVDMGDKGSKMILTFGAPIAHEYSERHAVHCGLELIKGYEDLKKWGVQQKVGISTGVVFAGEVGAPSRQEYTVMGSTVNLSARLMAKSEQGQLLVDEQTYLKTKDQFEYAEPFEVKFKGISQPLPVYSVISPKINRDGASAKHTVPIISRHNELTQIRSILNEVTEKNVRVVIVRGDPGVGKSRLKSQIVEDAAALNYRIAGGEALSYAKKSPYTCWISILRGLMGLPTTMKVADSIRRLEKIVEITDSEHRFRTPIIANLLGLPLPDNDVTRHFDAMLRQENLFDFLVQYFNYLTDISPVALVFEDTQWIDRNSLELIAYLLRSLENKPVVFILSQRPFANNFTDAINEVETFTGTAILDIDEFNREEAEAFVLQLLGTNMVSEKLLKFIYEASHGNPAFIEELINNLRNLEKIRIVTRTCKDGDVLCAEAVDDLADIEVPDSVNSLIMSQLDRLGSDAQLTVKVAAVIGRRFAESLVKGSYPVSTDQDVITKSIEELKTKTLISVNEDADFYNYIFKNLLTRDVAYDSLLFSHRREYHRLVGLCLEELHKDNLNEWIEDLARHFYQSEDDGRAIKYLKTAGYKAFDLYANTSAEDFFTRALERASAEKHPEERYYLLSQRAKVFNLNGKWEEYKTDLDEVLLIAEDIKNEEWKVDALDNLSAYYMQKSELKEMERVMNEALAILERIEYSRGTTNVAQKMGLYYYFNNKFDDALEWLDRSVDAAQRNNDLISLSTGLSNKALVTKAKGDLDTALRLYEQSLEIDRKEGNKKSETTNLGNIGVLYHTRGEVDKALEAYQQAFDLASSIGWKAVQARNLGNMAVILQSKGEREKALTSYEDKLNIEQKLGHHKGQIYTLSNIGSWYDQDGQFDEALSHYNEALKIAKNLDLTTEEARILLNIGETLHNMMNLEAARDSFIQAIELSVKIGYKLAEDYARRYLGFVLIDFSELEEAEEHFKKAQILSEALGSKVGLASAKVGLGYIRLLREADSDLIEEGIQDARSVGDPENYIRGRIALAKGMLKNGSEKEKAIEQLNDGLTIAQRARRRRDILVIEEMLNRLKLE